MDRRTVAAAERHDCGWVSEGGLGLGDEERVLGELVEWKLYQIHRAGQRKVERRGKDFGSGMPHSSDTKPCH